MQCNKTGFTFSLFNQAVHALFFTLSVYLLSAFILETAISFIGISWGTCTLVTLYRDHQKPDKQQKTINCKELRVKDSALSSPPGLLWPRTVLVTILLMLLTSVAVNAWLLNQKSQGKIPLVIAHRAGALYAPENSFVKPVAGGIGKESIGCYPVGF